jgi:hypothetical protein
MWFQESHQLTRVGAAACFFCACSATWDLPRNGRAAFRVVSTVQYVCSTASSRASAGRVIAGSSAGVGSSMSPPINSAVRRGSSQTCKIHDTDEATKIPPLMKPKLCGSEMPKLSGLTGSNPFSASVFYRCCGREAALAEAEIIIKFDLRLIAAPVFKQSSAFTSEYCNWLSPDEPPLRSTP